MKMHYKIKRLRALLVSYKSAVIAFSGGVDSTFLLSMAAAAMGKENVIAATAVSVIYPNAELREAKKIAHALGICHKIVKTRQIARPHFYANSSLRCYFCKDELFGTLKNHAQAWGMRVVCDASNFDDRKDYRPGTRAAIRRNIRRPLEICKITKAEIRRWSRTMGLSTWNKPSLACLASRFPYGKKITARALSLVERGERALKKLGFRVVRMRYYGDSVRIEVGGDEMHKFASARLRYACVRCLKRLGFIYITLDLEGFRSGSMNDVLQIRHAHV